MSSAVPVIRIENLTYAYGRSEAVRGLNLTVQRGRCYGLFGRNGAGKTTTMKCLLNLQHPQRGQVRVFGLDPTRHEVEVKRLLSSELEPLHRTGVVRAFRPRSGSAHCQPLQGSAYSSRLDRSHLPGDRP